MRGLRSEAHEPGQEMAADSWHHHVLSRGEPLGWFGLIAVSTYQLFAAVLDEAELGQHVLLSLLIVASVGLLVPSLRWSPPSFSLQRAAPAMVAAGTILVLASVESFTYRADATLMLAPYAFAWWGLFRLPGNLSAMAVIAGGAAAALAIAVMLPIASVDNEAEVRRILVFRAFEGLAALATTAFFIRYTVTRLAREQLDVAASLSRRSRLWARERAATVFLAGAALDLELEAVGRIRRTLSGRRADCAACEHLRHEIAVLDKDVDGLVGSELVEIGMQLRQLRRPGDASAWQSSTATAPN